jgi:hypothetical protein
MVVVLMFICGFLAYIETYLGCVQLIIGARVIEETVDE